MGGARLLNVEQPHYLGHKKRLKERFLKGGLESLTDYETIELILSLAIVRKDVKPLAKKLLEKFGSFSSLLDAGREELMSIHGMGPGAVTVLHLVKQSSTKYLQGKSREKTVLSSPSALIDYCSAAMVGLKDEEFRVIFLNSKNEIIDDEVLCKGTIDQTVVYPRKVIERALYHSASSMIFVHNHPSGSVSPSAADKELTKILKDAAATIQLRVHDHLIIGKDGHYSFAEKGFL